jgi:hypothetical protein
LAFARCFKNKHWTDAPPGRKVAAAAGFNRHVKNRFRYQQLA